LEAILKINGKFILLCENIVVDVCMCSFIKLCYKSRI